ncbi:Deaminated glutathione amidase [bioreactor metagenome]|uniref:Deaminated glutathione amidase n=1 Tax=bioreactor metagenome TaxID=1076179 RepID=A0A645FV96_9ZZZZ
MPEKREGKIYNTCFIFGKEGELLAKYSKTHLFDIDIKGKVSFKESDSIAKGEKIVTFDTEFGRFGIGICYDIRFPELSKLMVDEGAEMIFMPGAFNTTTGPAHWDLTLRARAVDNQVYFAVISLARDMNFSYHAYGHSGVSDPWGTIIGQCDENEGVVVCDIDGEKQNQIRQQLPLLQHRRKDLYTLEQRS